MWRSRWSLRILILKLCPIYHAPRFLTTRQAPLTRWSNSLKTLHQVCNERSRTYFSKQYPYIVYQTNNENTGSDHKRDVWMHHQIPRSNINKMYGNNFGEFILLVWACARRFSYNLFVLFCFQLPARLRTRWSLWWKTATPAQANQMKKAMRMNMWYVFTFFLIIHFFFFTENVKWVLFTMRNYRTFELNGGGQTMYLL